MILVGQKKWNLLRSNLNGADHIILGPKEFETQSQLLANHRKKTIYVPIENIYDEFSGGNIDPIAIRHFLHWTQKIGLQNLILFYLWVMLITIIETSLINQG